MKLTPRDSGSALLLAVVILAIFSAGAGVAWQAMHLQLKQGREARLQETALQLAEAGLEHAIAAIRQDRGWSGSGIVALGEGTYEVLAQASATEFGAFLLRSTGRIGDDKVEQQRLTLAAELRLREDGSLSTYHFRRVPKQAALQKDGQDQSALTAPEPGDRGRG